MTAKKNPVTPVPRTFTQVLLARLTEASTWAGLLTIGATFATGEVAAWLSPTTLPVLIAGAGLVLTEEGK